MKQIALPVAIANSHPSLPTVAAMQPIPTPNISTLAIHILRMVISRWLLVRASQRKSAPTMELTREGSAARVKFAAHELAHQGRGHVKQCEPEASPRGIRPFPTLAPCVLHDVCRMIKAMTEALATAVLRAQSDYRNAAERHRTDANPTTRRALEDARRRLDDVQRIAIYSADLPVGLQ